MITKTQNPNDAIDLFEIERQARALRAVATRDMLRNISQWFAARRPEANSSMLPLKG